MFYNQNFLQIGPCIDFSEVYELIKTREEKEGYVSTKKDILKSLGLEDTKENLSLLSSALKEMKKQEMIISTWCSSAYDGHLCGKGFLVNLEYQGPNRK